MKLNKSDYLIIFLFALLTIIVGYYFLNKKITTQQKVIQLQQQLQELEERKKKIEQIDTDRLAEDISSILLGTYFSTSTDIEVEGVEIINKGDRKLVINHQEGYQIEIPGNLILNQSRRADALEFDHIDRVNDPGISPRYWTIMFISTFSSNDEKYKSWMQKEISHPLTTTTLINGEKFYKAPRIREEDQMIIVYAYYLIKPNKIYEIDVEADEEWLKYVETFKLIKQE